MTVKTDAGTGILESARRMEREMLAIERSLEVHATALCGEVTISATEGTGTEWLTPVLFDFHLQYPEILVKVQVDNRPVDLLHREADLALRLGKPEQPALIARHEEFPGNCVYVSNSPAAQIAAVDAGFGIGSLSHRWAAMRGGLIRVLPDYNPNSIDMWPVSHEELRYSARIRALSDFIADRVQADALQFESGIMSP